MNFCCWCGKTHKEEKECWLKSKEAYDTMFKPMIDKITKEVKKYE